LYFYQLNFYKKIKVNTSFNHSIKSIFKLLSQKNIFINTIYYETPQFQVSPNSLRVCSRPCQNQGRSLHGRLTSCQSISFFISGYRIHHQQ
jgi:hypothetical protein